MGLEEEEVSAAEGLRVYEVERETKLNTWEFVGNITVDDWSIVSTFLRAAESRDWPVGDYRLNHWDENFASGSFFLITLRTGERVAELTKPVAPVQDKEPGEVAA